MAPGQVLLSFLDGFSGMSVPSTLLPERTTPRQALLPLLGTLPGAMVTGTLSLQGTMSLQAFLGLLTGNLHMYTLSRKSYGRTRGLRDCVRGRNVKYEKGRKFTDSVSPTHGRIHRTCAGCTTRWARSRSPNNVDMYMKDMSMYMYEYICTYRENSMVEHVHMAIICGVGFYT